MDTLVPGIQRPGLERTRLDHSVVHDAVRPTGVYVVSRTAADDVESAIPVASGLLAAHAHLTTDGRRAIVVTEWVDAASHEAAVAPAGPGFTRYALHHAFADDRVVSPPS
ncbi:hypothetical protein [Streptomyces radicis]|uniref:hypothetical protein n=1 Tax=Streptomyces radicis TaxID=1750517 RepID=UPI0011C360A6|nr:hypothetical protein [Streptomyces radicis]